MAMKKLGRKSFGVIFVLCILSGQVVADQPQAIPETSLKFRMGMIDGVKTEITPEIVQKFAKLGRVKRPVMSENVVSLQGFFDFREKRTKSHSAGIFVAVVVEGELDLEWHREVHEYLATMMVGYETPRGAQAPGYAEVFGAEVQGVIPVRYHAGAEITFPAVGNTPIRVGDIIVAVNDTPFGLFDAKDEDKDRYEVRLPSRIVELEAILESSLLQDRHRFTYDEYVQNKDAIKAVAQARYADEIPDSLESHKSLDRTRE